MCVCVCECVCVCMHACVRVRACVHVINKICNYYSECCIIILSDVIFCVFP